MNLNADAEAHFEDVDADLEGEAIEGDGEAVVQEGSGRSGLVEMAMSTQPSRPLDVVESPWDPERGGSTRLMRAAEKAFGVDGIPAIIDAIVGLVEMWVARTGEGEVPIDSEWSEEPQFDET